MLAAILLFALPVWAKPDLSNQQDKEPIVLISDCLPEYPGGEKAMLKFLNSNINPLITCEGLCSYSCRVIVRFDIDNCGKVDNVHLVKGETRLGNEAIRVVKLLPDFIPCKNQWGTVTYNLPIQFCL